MLSEDSVLEAVSCKLEQISGNIANDRKSLETELQNREHYYESIRAKIRVLEDQNSGIRERLVESDAVIARLESTISKIKQACGSR